MGILKDIRVLIVVFFVIRLYGIMNPPVEATHSWRQCLTNMEARNFLEIDNNILYPRIDMKDEKTGIIAGEFPLFNYIIYLCSAVFGYSHWIGRLINLIISSIGMFYFYKLIKLHFGDKLAFNATLILLCSLWFSFSRKIMPDTFSVSLVLIGMYYGMRYLYEKEKIIYLAFYFIFCCAGAMSKIPSMLLMSVFVLPLFSKEISVKKKILLCVFSFLIMLPVAWWYGIWVNYLLRQYQFQLYFYDFSLAEGFRQLILDQGGKTLSVFYFNAFCGFIASLFFLAGFIYLFVERNRKMVFIVVCILPLFLFFMLKTGMVFATHNYYVLPFLPFMSLVTAYLISKIRSEKVHIIIICFICVEGILNQYHDFKKNQRDNYKLKLESIADQFSDKDDLVAVNGGGDPQQMYFLHRKGWDLNNDKVVDKNYTDLIAVKGCELLFINKRSLKENISAIKYATVYEDEDYKVFKLEE